jgi:hypothetical protein
VNDPANVVLVCVSMTLAVASIVCAWDARRQAQRAQAAYAEIERLRGTE